MRVLETLSRVAFLSLTLVGFTHPSQALAKPANPQFQTVTDKERGFVFSVPRGWDQQRNAMGAAVIALSPQESARDTFRENVNVVVEELGSTMSTKEYFTASQSLIKKAFNEFKLEKTGQSRVGLQEFYWSVFTHRIGTIRAKVLQYVTVTGNKAYVVTASAAPDKFAKYRPQFESIINTFRLEAKGNKSPASEKK